jgi:2-oxo-4-hydroxy-4-carboxy-5-ureidoimidazoline decarboxylase
VNLARFNRLSGPDAERLLLGCCSASRWARAVAARRPYPSVAALQAAAEAELTEPDVRDGLTGHPRIGERTHDPRSAREQRRVAGAPAEVLAALAEGNRAYERRFGHVYLVCASGRDAPELLEVLRERLGNDPVTEWRAVRGELAAINRLRLALLVAAEPLAEGVR